MMRGGHLVRADRRFATGDGLVARIAAPAFAAVLERIDRRLGAAVSKCSARRRDALRRIP